MTETFYDPTRETWARDQLRELQEEKLRHLLGALGSNGFYARKLAASGVEASAVSTLEDLRRLPFTTKAELVEAQERRPPYGDLLTYPPARYRYLHQTSGTTGRPLLWLDTPESWRTWLRCWGHVYRGAGVGEDDVVFCAFSFGPYVAHWSSLEGARAVGALALPGSGLSSLERLGKIFEHGVDAVVATPTYALHLAEVAAANGLDLATSRVRATICAGEPGASVPGVKRALETAWGARVFDHAGATEVGAWGFDCLAEDHDLHLNELEFIFEVVDPETGEAVADGERGELVVTTLGRTGMPVVRYKTGDLVVRSAEPCSCGRRLARLRGGVLGRADDMLIVRGVNVFPSALDNLVRQLPEIVEYEVDVRQVEALHDLTVKIEVTPAADPGTAKAKLAELFHSRLGIRVEIAPVPGGSLPRYELKARRFRRVSEA